MRPLDYANAGYTRVYNEDPAELEMAGYDVQNLLHQIQRRMDRSGVFAFGSVDMVSYICHRTRASREQVERDLPVLLAIGALVLRGDALVDPEFVPAQTTSKSNKQRQREFRDRHRDEALSQPPPACGDLFENQSRNESLRVTDVTHGEEKESVGEVSVSSSSEDPRSLPDTTHAREPAAGSTPLVEPRAPVLDLRASSAAIGYRWLDDAMGGGGRAPDLQAWRDEYARIAAKPATERALVAKHLMASDYIIAEPRKAKPNHILKFWDDFVAGPKNVLRPYDRPGPAKLNKGPSEVSPHSVYVREAELSRVGGGSSCDPF